MSSIRHSILQLALLTGSTLRRAYCREKREEAFKLKRLDIDNLNLVPYMRCSLIFSVALTTYLATPFTYWSPSGAHRGSVKCGGRCRRSTHSCVPAPPDYGGLSFFLSSRKQPPSKLVERSEGFFAPPTFIFLSLSHLSAFFILSWMQCVWCTRRDHIPNWGHFWGVIDYPVHGHRSILCRL